MTRLFLFFIFGVLVSFVGCKNHLKSKVLLAKVKNPIVIAHRGAQSIYPEHTLEGYKKAIELGADFIEPDLVMTKDGILVARHEPYISGTTDIAQHPEFQDRKTTKIIDGDEVTDWFVSDFTLAEIKTLRARQARSERSTEYDGLYEIPTFKEVMRLAQTHQTLSGNPVGIYPELKHPTYHSNIGHPMIDVFLKAIDSHGFNAKEAPIYVQCFEVATLQKIRERSTVRLVQLIGAAGISSEGVLQFTKDNGAYDPEGAPFDFYKDSNPHTYAWFATDEGMRFVASYADAIGPWKAFVIPYQTSSGKAIKVLPSTDFVHLAHKNGLKVHPYTFRDEDAQWQAKGKLVDEITLFMKVGIDGFFTDNTSAGVKALSKYKDF